MRRSLLVPLTAAALVTVGCGGAGEGGDKRAASEPASRSAGLADCLERAGYEPADDASPAAIDGAEALVAVQVPDREGELVVVYEAPDLSTAMEAAAGYADGSFIERQGTRLFAFTSAEPTAGQARTVRGCVAGAGAKAPVVPEPPGPEPAPQNAPSATEAVRAAVKGYYRALGAGDGEAACALLTQGGRSRMLDAGGELDERLEGAACAEIAEAIGALFAQVDLGDVRVGDIEVNGHVATARAPVGIDGYEPETLELIQLEGEWRLNAT